MRKVEIGTQNFTTVYALDEPGQGGACHIYNVVDSNKSFADIGFQNGPIKEFGVNGCHHEDLIAIVIDRLQHFQAGKWKCHENEMALVALNTSLKLLGLRTMDRENRGVEGTNKL